MALRDAPYALDLFLIIGYIRGNLSVRGLWEQHDNRSKTIHPLGDS